LCDRFCFERRENISIDKFQLRAGEDKTKKANLQKLIFSFSVDLKRNCFPICLSPNKCFKGHKLDKKISNEKYQFDVFQKFLDIAVVFT